MPRKKALPPNGQGAEGPAGSICREIQVTRGVTVAGDQVS